VPSGLLPGGWAPIRGTTRDRIVTISDLGSIGEFVSAIAVLVTLAYLAIQTRHNAVATRAQIRQSLADRQIDYINLRATNP
jgi:hypothetical protein